MPTVVTTPGAADANSYASVAEGDAYHATRLQSGDWTSAVQATKETALIMATRLMDALYDWDQWSTSPLQALQWPRMGMLDAKRLSYVEDDVIPTELKNATAEFARQLIAEDRTGDFAVEAQGITSLRAGPVALTFKESVSAKVVPDAVVSLLPPWWGSLRGRGGALDLLRA